MFIDVVRECGGIGRSSVFDRFAEDMAARRDSGEGRLRIAAKDMSSMIDVASGCAVETPLLKQTESLFRQAIAAGLADCQFTDIIRIANAAEPAKHD
jgi:3-hydroxyisobutyrate dehydrogenase-like beta-hydroxyacid dehydrogenase